MCQECIKNRNELTSELTSVLSDLKKPDIMEEERLTLLGELDELTGGRDVNDISMEERGEIARRLVEETLVDDDETPDEIIKMLHRVIDSAVAEGGPVSMDGIYTEEDLQDVYSFIGGEADLETDQAEMVGLGHAGLATYAIRHYLNYHYTDYHSLRSLLGNETMGAFHSVGEKYSRGLVGDTNTYAGAMIYDHSEFMGSIAALITATMIEGFCMGLFAGTKGQDCVFHMTHDEMYGQLAHQEEINGPDDTFNMRIDEMRNRILKYVLERRNSTENEENASK